MKKFNLIIVFILIFNLQSCQIKKQNISIEEIQQSVDNGFVDLKFKIINNTKDTLFISDKNLDFQIVKKGKIIPLEYAKIHIQPFIKPVLKNTKQVSTSQQKSILEKTPKDKMAISFAKKLFEKNLEKNKYLVEYEELIVQHIFEDCIVSGKVFKS